MFIFSKIISSCFSKNFKIFPASCFLLTDPVWKSTCFWKLTRLSVILLRATWRCLCYTEPHHICGRPLLPHALPAWDGTCPPPWYRIYSSLPVPFVLSVERTSVFKAEKICLWHEIPLWLDQFYIYSSVVSWLLEYKLFLHHALSVGTLSPRAQENLPRAAKYPFGLPNRSIYICPSMVFCPPEDYSSLSFPFR